MSTAIRSRRFRILDGRGFGRRAGALDVTGIQMLMPRRTFRHPTRSAARADPANLRYVIFHTAADLEVLRRRDLLKRRGILLLRIPSIESDQRRRWEAALNARLKQIWERALA